MNKLKNWKEQIRQQFEFDAVTFRPKYIGRDNVPVLFLVQAWVERDTWPVGSRRTVRIHVGTYIP